MKKTGKKMVLILFVLLMSKSALLAQPMMGWSSWNANFADINEALIKETADSVVSLGLKDVGYTWVNIDDGFFAGRNAEGVLQINSKFPNGMRIVSDYIRAKGLNPGIYSEIGTNTCASYAGQDSGGRGAGLWGHEEQDLRLFFGDWNYDFIKVDYCGGWHGDGIPGGSLRGKEEESYTRVSNVISLLEEEYGRDLRLNICRWGFPGTWARDVADSWRTSGDILENFTSIKEIIELNTYLAPYASPGKYNDMDMLQLGRGFLTHEEEKTHFGMWAIMTSPLIIGCNFDGIPQSSVDILKNEEIIAVNQDPLSLQAELVAGDGNCMVYSKTIEEAHGKVRAVALYNSTGLARTIRVNFNDIQLSGKGRIRDLWEHKDLGEFTGYYEVRVPAHGIAMLRIEGEQAIDKLRYQGEYAYMNKFAAIDLAENARFEKTPNIVTSGGHILSWLGFHPENWAEYRDVYVSEGGKYTFKLYYLSGMTRDLSVIVNGQEHLIRNLNSGGWDRRATTEIEIELNKGSNVIRLANETGWAPNIDKFELIPEGGSIEADPFDMIDTSGDFPIISSEDNTNETWYYIQFKLTEGVLQDMGENQFLLTKAMANQNNQHWKVVQVADASGDYKYRIVNKSGRSLSHVAVPETTDGFYKTTGVVSDMVKFKIVGTTNQDYVPAWELERQGSSRRFNQYDPQQSFGYDKNLSEWDANDRGNPLIFVPVTSTSSMDFSLNSSNTKIYLDGLNIRLEGEDITSVSLYSVNGQLAGVKKEDPFSFSVANPGYYLAIVKYKNNRTETLKVVI